MQGPSWSEPREWPSDARRERIIGDWALYQRIGGHRSSTDDVLTAYFAARRSVDRRIDLTDLRYLDLGCGVGSVLLMTAHRLRPAHCVGIEAQPQSVSMVQKAVAELPEGAPPIRIESGDFRESRPHLAPFGLVTGSPPYFPLGTGSLPDDPQRRACRFEARGGIEAYCETAAKYLAAGARFYAVFQTTWDQRVLDAAKAAKLHLTARLDAHMRSDRTGPFLTVYELSKTPDELVSEAFAIRDTQGEITPEYQAARDFMGL